MDTTTEFVGGPTTESITAFSRPANDGLARAQNAANLRTEKADRRR